VKDHVESNAVSAWEETVVIPTYPAPAPDPNPMFLEKRVNQGTSGRVYPNPFTDHVSNEKKVDRPYRAVWLENEYVRLMILPEIGGRIHVGLDKTNDYNFFYRQHVVKPALIGLFGPWISGGVEFNWPMHHRPSTFMPVDHCIEEHADGSRTVWLSEHEPMGRMKGMVGICLHPGKALIEAKVQLYNRTPYVQTFLWWVNVAVHVNEQYQVFFPPDVTYVTFHARQDMSHYPIARGTYCGIDFTQGVDISWPKNVPASTSFFVVETRYDFFGGYDHGRQAGLVHVANRYVAPGKKLFTWGSGEFGRAWERNLTDADGPYVELMAGAYSDNQPDLSWLQPYETKTFSQYWYPIQRIGPAKNANRRAAVNLEANGRRAMLGVCAAEVFRRAVVRLEASDRVLFEREVNLIPGAPFVAEAGLPKGIADGDLLLRVCTPDGHEIIRYTPEHPQEKPLPPAATPPPPPQEIEAAEELFLTGLHLEQYHHATWYPEPYWEEALRRDSGDVRCNNALGLTYLQRGEFALAEQHFRRAIQTLTRRNPNPRDGELTYNLGLALKHQQRLDEAYAAFYKAIWSQAWQAAGYYALAEIDCWRADFGTALEHLERSLLTNALNTKARNLKAAALRHLGQYEQAEALARQTVALDPLDFWSRNELVLLCRARGEEPSPPSPLPGRARGDTADAGHLLEELSGLMRGAVQTYLDVAYDYAGAGLWDEASDLLARLVARPGEGGPVYPIVLYSLGYLAHQRGEEAQAREFYRQATEMPPDYCFPVRLEEMEVLQHAVAANPQDAQAFYYLGNLLYDKKRYEEAIRHWEAACRLQPGLAIPWRNLGIAYYNVRRDPEQARRYYVEALEANPCDGRLLYELDQLTKRLGTPPAERLAHLEQHLDLVEQRADLFVEQAALYNQLGQPHKALDLLLSRRFYPWEGGEGTVSGQYATAHLLLGRTALETGDAQGALDHLEAAQHYPESLGEGKHRWTSEAHLHYFAGLAREALGDAEGAKTCFRQAAETQDGFSPATYYQALALGKLGEAAACHDRLLELLDFASRQMEAEAEFGYFGTSIANFLLFEDDLRKLNRIHYTYMAGLAYLGLEQVSQAREAFEQVLALDVNHVGAQEELKRLT